MMTINQRLNEYLTKNGIKQCYVAQKTGLSNDTVSKIMLGARRILATEFLDICDALDLDPREFSRHHDGE